MTRARTAERSIAYGKRTIAFQFIRAARKTLEITVHPDMSVVVKAPKDAHLDHVDTRVRKRARWILKQQSFFEQFQPRTPARSYVTGETHMYLGRRHRLRVLSRKDDSVSLTNGVFVVGCTSPAPRHVAQLLNQWYRERAEIQFDVSFGRCWPRFRKLGLKEPAIQIRPMKRRWGSVSRNGRITLNPRLVQAPKACIDYVICHELCHLKYHHHGPAFYELLETMVPNWKTIKQQLEQSLA